MEPKRVPPSDPSKAVFPPATPNKGEKTVTDAKHQSFSTFATELKIDVWDLIEFNFPSSKNKPDVVNWYLYNKMGCRETTADGYNYRFSNGMKIYYPIAAPAPTPGPGIPPPKAHPFRQGWTAQHIANFHRHAEAKALIHANTYGFVIDCADFASQLLMDYALPNYLPIGFQYSGGVLRAEVESIVLIDRFRKDVKQRIGAPDLNNPAYPQTVRLSGLPAAKSGDILSNPHHVIVVYKYPSSIYVPEIGGSRQVLEVLQGNLDTYPIVGDLPTRVQHRAWELKARIGYVEEGNGWVVREHEARNADDIVRDHVPKRWNFSWFNQIYGFPPV